MPPRGIFTLAMQHFKRAAILDTNLFDLSEQYEGDPGFFEVSSRVRMAGGREDRLLTSRLYDFADYIGRRTYFETDITSWSQMISNCRKPLVHDGASRLAAIYDSAVAPTLLQDPTYQAQIKPQMHSPIAPLFSGDARITDLEHAFL